MRNDPHLYEEKLNYIKEVIKENFQFQSIDEGLIEEINIMKKEKVDI